MQHLLVWSVSLLSMAGVIIRPFKVPEAVWAVTGSILLLVFGIISPSEGITAIAKGLDVYLFLTGMMLLAETAREEKLFDWLAAHATKLARGSANRLFLLTYGVGVIVTVFLSNDATAVVLTPAVAAAVKVAGVEKPLPYLLICAFTANAASFVLPISNPANLVVYGSSMPPLLTWLPEYFLPSVFSIAVTYIVLRFTQHNELQQNIGTKIPLTKLSPGGKMAFWGIVSTAFILLFSSGLNIPLGLPTVVLGAVTSLIVIIRTKKSPLIVIRGVSWSVLPLVAGLFVIVEALNKTGLTQIFSELIHQNLAHSVTRTMWGSGLITAFTCNLMNNLPAGLMAGNAIQTGRIPEVVKSAVLIGIDLGPNLSISGSIATILWLVALRREGQSFSFGAFLKLGSLLMVPALLAAIAALLI